MASGSSCTMGGDAIRRIRARLFIFGGRVDRGHGGPRMDRSMARSGGDKSRIGGATIYSPYLARNGSETAQGGSCGAPWKADHLTTI